VGLSLPLWFVPHQSRVRAAELSKHAAENDFEYHQRNLQSQMQQAMRQLTTNLNSLSHYSDVALPNAELILKQSQVAFREGEIDYAEYLLSVRNAVTVQENYLKTLNDYNQTIIYIDYLTGKK
jgi:cobalt-zinc-cadmium resistance protein CzcA